MLYYLSYIEVAGEHSCLMLSQQSSIDKPAKIIKNLGFFPRLDEIEDGVAFRVNTFEGEIQDEDVASLGAYSSKKIYHRTFAISSYEKDLFIKFIDEDRNINRQRIVENKKERYVGGPDYQFLQFNCKSYALNILDRMGIVDVKDLNDFLVQIPGHKKNKLSHVKKTTYERSVVAHAFRLALDELDNKVELELPYRAYIEDAKKELMAEISSARKDCPDRIGIDYDPAHFDKLIGLMKGIRKEMSMHVSNVNMAQESKKGIHFLDKQIKKMNELSKKAAAVKSGENEFICPLKDSYVLEANKELDTLKELLKDKRFKKPYLRDIMKDIHKKIADASQVRQEKIGIGFYKDMNHCDRLYNSFIDLHQLLYDNKADKDLIRLVRKHKTTLDSLGSKALEINTKFNKEELKYYWREMPKLTDRAEIITDEKVRIHASIKAKELHDRFDDMLQMLHGAVKSSDNKDFKRDLKTLIKIVSGSKQALHELTPKLRDKESDMMQVKRQLNQIVLDLEKKMTHFKPLHKKTNLFMRMIDLIISFFRKSYIAHDADLVAKSAVRHNLRYFAVKAKSIPQPILWTHKVKYKN